MNRLPRSSAVRIAELAGVRVLELVHHQQLEPLRPGPTRTLSCSSSSARAIQLQIIEVHAPRPRLRASYSPPNRSSSSPSSAQAPAPAHRPHPALRHVGPLSRLSGRQLPDRRLPPDAGAKRSICARAGSIRTASTRPPGRPQAWEAPAGADPCCAAPRARPPPSRARDRRRTPPPGRPPRCAGPPGSPPSARPRTPARAAAPPGPRRGSRTRGRAPPPADARASSRAQNPWNVLTNAASVSRAASRSPSSLEAACTRSRSSPAARSVNVIAKILPGATPSSRTARTNRSTSTEVLPAARPGGQQAAARSAARPPAPARRSKSSRSGHLHVRYENYAAMAFEGERGKDAGSVASDRRDRLHASDRGTASRSSRTPSPAPADRRVHAAAPVRAGLRSRLQLAAPRLVRPPRAPPPPLPPAAPAPPRGRAPSPRTHSISTPLSPSSTPLARRSAPAERLIKAARRPRSPSSSSTAHMYSATCRFAASIHFAAGGALRPL